MRCSRTLIAAIQLTEVSAAASTYKIAIVAGMLEEVPDESRGYNTLYVTDRLGNYATHYRKVHFHDAFGLKESDIVKPSESLDAVIFDIGPVAVGLMICR